MRNSEGKAVERVGEGSPMLGGDLFSLRWFSELRYPLELPAKIRALMRIKNYKLKLNHNTCEYATCGTT
jgi:hypothetical protein